MIRGKKKSENRLIISLSPGRFTTVWNVKYQQNKVKQLAGDPTNKSTDNITYIESNHPPPKVERQG